MIDFLWENTLLESWFCCIRGVWNKKKKKNHDSVIQKGATKFWLRYFYKNKKKNTFIVKRGEKGKKKKNEWMNEEKEEKKIKEMKKEKEERVVEGRKVESNVESVFW